MYDAGDAMNRACATQGKTGHNPVIIMDALRQGCLAAALLALIGTATTAHADIWVKVEESINNAPPITVVHWFGHARTMRDDGDRYIITRLDQGLTYVVNRKTKRYRVVKMKLSKAPGPGVKVQATDDHRMISGWPTQRYRVTGEATGDLTIDIWVTTAMDTDLSDFHRLMVRLGNRAGSAWMKAYQQIPGFPIMQVVTLKRPGIRLHSKSKVVAFKRAQPGPNTYSPPHGYKKVQMLTSRQSAHSKASKP